MKNKTGFSKFVFFIIVVVAMSGLLITTNTSFVSAEYNSAKEKYDERYCDETDGGRDYYTQGTIKYANKGRTTLRTDRCHRSIPNKLIEYYCRANKYYSVGYTCPGGCEDGACVECEPSYESTVTCDGNVLTETTTNSCTDEQTIQTNSCDETWIPDNTRIQGVCRDYGDNIAGCVPCGYRGCFSTEFRVYDQCYWNHELWSYKLWVEPVPANQGCQDDQIDFGVAGEEFGQEMC